LLHTIMVVVWPQRQVGIARFINECIYVFVRLCECVRERER